LAVGPVPLTQEQRSIIMSPVRLRSAGDRSTPHIIEKIPERPSAHHPGKILHGAQEHCLVAAEHGKRRARSEPHRREHKVPKIAFCDDQARKASANRRQESTSFGLHEHVFKD